LGFTIRRFLNFSIERQHKKCAEILKNTYELLLHNGPADPAIEEYNTIQSWMGDNYTIEKNPKRIADRYHWHLQQAHYTIKEPNFLTSIKRNDKNYCEVEPWPIAIYLDHLRSAHNVGSIIRTVEALALGVVYFSTSTPFIDNKQVQDASMGTYQWTKCIANAALTDLPKPLIVLETSTFAIPIHEFLFPEIFTLVVGNEEYGCSDEILEKADYLVEIPLRGRKNSLNVANAFAIGAAEIQRQKNFNVKEKS
jgi:tRNA G18 (ribose-2'-O)-methylase SpoU